MAASVTRKRKSKDTTTKKGPKRSKRENVKDLPTESVSDDDLEQENEGLVLREGRNEELTQPSQDFSGTMREIQAQVDDNTTGKIKSIYCEDFMCHEKLKVDFGKKVNFITGSNGSGKSAIIAALQVCLGLAANKTGRASKIGDLIRKQSKGRAVVRVTLYNDGSYPYKQDIYGSSIVIERILLRNSAASSYFIRNGDTKKEVSRKKADIMHIVTRFNIALDNPCCVLDQETSKNFLGGNAKEKYNVFMNGTHLKSIKTCYQAVERDRQRTKALMELKKPYINELYQKWEAKETNLKRLERLKDIEEHASELSHQKSWALVEEIEAELEKYQKSMSELQMKIQKYREELQELQELQEENGESATVLKIRENLAQVQSEMNSNNDKRSDITIRLEEVSRKEQRCTQSLTRLQHEMKNEERNYRAATEAIKALDRESGRAVDQESHLALLRSQLEEAQEVAKTLDRESEAIRIRLTEAYQEQDKLNEERRKSEGLYTDAKSRLRDAETLKVDLEARGKDSNARFGAHVPRLLNELQRREREFTRLPLHVGMHVELLNHEWKVPVEQCLRRCLECFILNNRDDFSVFENVCKSLKIFPTPKTLVMKFTDKRIDTSARRPNVSFARGRVVLMEDVLNCTEPNVFNALVEDAMMDGCTLARSTEDAIEFAFKRVEGSLGVRNAKICYNMEGDAFSVRNGSEYKQSYYPSRQSLSLLTVSDVNPEEIKSVEDEISKAQEDTKKHRKDLQKIGIALKQVKDRINKIEGEKSKLATRKIQNRDLEERVQNQIAQAEETNTSSFERMAKENAQAQAENNMKELKLKTEALEEELASIQKDQEPLTLIQNELVQELHQLRERDMNLNNSLEQALAQSSRVKSKIKQINERLQRRLSRVPELQEEINRKQQVCERAIKCATDICADRIDLKGRTKEQIEAELQQFKKDVTEEMKRISPHDVKLSPAELVLKAEEELKNAKREYTLEREAYEKITETVRLFKVSLKNREADLQTLRRISMRKMNLLFGRYLAIRNHSGNVIFDEKNETLDFEWQKTSSTGATQDPGHESSVSERVIDAGQLSGGEKSFTTLAFLVAMGALVDCPFRIMDEFDVFMDSSNRKTSMGLLIAMAKGKASMGKQFIFITPHDISQVEDSPDVRKLRLRSPKVDTNGTRMEQTTLPFSH
eukprot:CAMPEP_0184528386 /NCGR_PEP_ID=MMETSP0198_2-20121128/11761_1 /TAXON_ID=1112570 /ORGANISM="Thraustochytrium sp., Strain LLF1b" /LENGTH=1171 /DNA_ID=CAMNT_0026920223 /DNA_START=276 /DNA_END=3791 /DNA_ORIENTATION=+